MRCRLMLATVVAFAAGCQQMVRDTDREIENLIAVRQQEALQRKSPARVGTPAKLPKPGPSAYSRTPNAIRADVPPSFATAAAQPTSRPTSPSAADFAPTSAPTTEPTRVFTLTDALAYAQHYRREYQAAKEDLYLAALALTLERHLWTPIFASNLRTVYGNYGEAQHFDQAMRFVADLSVSQRLPYGGEFTAAAVSTLIRDVKKTITAAEGSTLNFGVNIPFLRGAGHLAQEALIQLERELTYAVRTFERFRRQQLVRVAQSYFGLLTAKQRVLDSEESYRNFQADLERARALEATGTRTLLDTQRAEQAVLDAENTVESTREDFRGLADQFKLLIGMPVDAPLASEQLEDIETIERHIEDGLYPLLQRPLAADSQEQAISVALGRRFDLLTAGDRIDDARRGVKISRNALLPDLNLTSSLAFDTPPEHYSMTNFTVDRANWRAELLLSLPLERMKERNDLRRALLTVTQAERSQIEQAERVRVEVRRAVNNIWLQERLLEIQRRNVEVTAAKREFAQLQYEDGKIDNRDVVDAQRELDNARNRFNLAKTERWAALLEFRFTTETLLVDEDGTQPPGDLPTQP